MDQVQDIIKIIFGDMGINVSSIVTLFDTLALIVMVVLQPILKTKLSKSNSENQQLKENNKEQKVEIDKLKKSISYLANIIVSCYMGNNNIPPEMKREIASMADELCKEAGVKLSINSQVLIDKVVDYVDHNTNVKNIIEVAEATKESIEKAIEENTDAIDKINL